MSDGLSDCMREEENKQPSETKIKSENLLDGYEISGFDIVLTKPAQLASESDKTARLSIKKEDKRQLEQLKTIIDELLGK